MPPSRSRVRMFAAGVTLIVVASISLLDRGASDDLDRGASRDTATIAGSDVRVEVLGTTRSRPASVRVVKVMAQGCDGFSTGSGAIVAPDRVLTARHVLDGVSEATVVLDSGQSLPARVLSMAPDGRDSALLEVPALPSSTYPPLAPAPMRAGSTVTVNGHPHGRALQARVGVLLGMLDSGPLALDGGRVLTLDVAIDPGMSGGPVIDDAGQLVGVAIGYDRATRTGIAVPVDVIADLLGGDGEAPRSSAC